MVSKFYGIFAHQFAHHFCDISTVFSSIINVESQKKRKVHLPPETATFSKLKNYLSIGYMGIFGKIEKRMDSNPLSYQNIQNQPFKKQKSITRKLNDGF